MAVTPPNIPPDTLNVARTTPEDTPVNVPLIGTDVLGGIVVSFTIVLTLPAHGHLTDLHGNPLTIGSVVPAIGNQVQIVYVPDPDFTGVDTFRFASHDNGGLNDPTPATATITITPVNDPPTTNDSSGSGVEDGPPIPLMLTGADVDGTVVSFTINSLPMNGVLKDSLGNVLSIGSVVPAVGNAATVFFYADANWNGTTTFNYASHDNQGLDDGTPATGTIVVTPVNDPPETYDSSGSGVEDGPPIPLVLTGADIDGTVDCFTISTLPANGVLRDANGNVLSIGSVVIATGNAATVFFTPDANWNGTTTFLYASKDNEGLNDPTPAVGTIVVTPVNDPPETFNSSGSGLEDGPPILLTLTGSDIDGTVDCFTISTLPANGVLRDANGNVLSVGSVVTATGNSANVFFTPDANWNGTTTFLYASKDNEGLNDPTPAVGTIVVTPVNDPPETFNSSGSGVEDGPPIPLTLTGSDIDGTVDCFTISTLPANGVLRDANGNVLSIGSVVIATGNAATVFFTPDANWNGTTTFLYASKDNEGLNDPTPATGTIVVTPVNDPPETFNSSGSGVEDGPPIALTLTGSDIDGTVITFTLADLPANGVLKDSNGNVLSVGSMLTATGNAATVFFTPNADWNGTTVFHYASKDNEGLSDATPATGTIVVTPVNDPPNADDDFGNTTVNTPIQFTTTQLLANDEDPDNDPLTVISVQGAVNGTVTLVSGVATWTPNLNFTGTGSFTYTISDGHGGTDTATVTITIPAPPPPAPGVGTPGFWSNNGAVYWDGVVDASGVKHGGNFPAGELTYSVDKDGNGTKDGVALLIGDFNRNGLTDAGEHTLVLSLADAKAIVSGGGGSDALNKIGRDVVASWLNFLAGNSVGGSATANTPAWYINEAVDWFAAQVGTTLVVPGGVTTINATSGGAFISNVGKVGNGSASWATGINKDATAGVQSGGVDVMAGTTIHTILDTFNNTGKIGSVQWANDRDMM